MRAKGLSRGARSHRGAMRPVRRVAVLRLLSIGSAIAVFGTMLMGGYTSASGSGLACPDWPLCRG
ncbi:MAG: COX15/CtaA family protein, partial [Methanobacteriota archaeon]